MKVLIVDDVDAKAAQIETTLRNAVSTLELQRAKSVRGAIKQLESHTYDLVVLDLLLPLRDGESPTQQGGKQVLSEISDDSGCRHPSNIICLTAFQEMAIQIGDEAATKLVHVMVYDEDRGTWRQSLSQKAEIIQERLRAYARAPQDFSTDVAIVTSAPHVELNEVLKLPNFIGEYNQRDVLRYYSAKWNTKHGLDLSVVACASPTMGMTAACITAIKVIERWRPRFLVMSGIAAGTKKDQKYGDILVAEAAYDYGSGKIIETKGRNRQFQPSFSQFRIDADLHAVLQQWERDQSQMDDIRKAWYIEQPRSPHLYLGVLATGAAVVQDKSLVSEILEKSRKVVGIDMEGYAIFHAAHLATFPRPRVLVAKSVSDFADKRKNDTWQQYAAFTSAQFIYQFFTHAAELNLGKK